MPPATATYARVPRNRRPNVSREPGATAQARFGGTLRPFTATSNSAPLTAITRSSSNSSSGPSHVTSSVAVSSALPTSALASRWAYASIGPATDTPRD